jgi:hypothetical protein
MDQNYDNFNTNPNRIVGIFEREGKTLTAPGVKLLISERKKPTPNKTKHFLVNKTTDRYISSLFETEALYTYNFDHKGVKYLLTLHPTYATITLRT